MRGSYAAIILIITVVNHLHGAPRQERNKQELQKNEFRFNSEEVEIL